MCKISDDCETESEYNVEYSIIVLHIFFHLQQYNVKMKMLLPPYISTHVLSRAA